MLNLLATMAAVWSTTSSPVPVAETHSSPVAQYDQPHRLTPEQRLWFERAVEHILRDQSAIERPGGGASSRH